MPKENYCGYCKQQFKNTAGLGSHMSKKHGKKGKHVHANRPKHVFRIAGLPNMFAEHCPHCGNGMIQLCHFCNVCGLPMSAINQAVAEHVTRSTASV